jgi:hypothetical protein
MLQSTTPGGRLDHRHDSSADGIGQSIPSLDDGGQTRVIGPSLRVTRLVRYELDERFLRR